MGIRVEWHSPLSPAEVKQALAEVTDTKGGIPMFTPKGMGGSGLWMAGSQPLLGTMNQYGFQVQMQPAGRSSPFATFCNAKVKPSGTGSRVEASFGLHIAPTILYFVTFGWAFVLSFADGVQPVRFPYRPDASTVILLAAVCVAFFARWRVRRDTPALEAFLERTLMAAPAQADPPQSLAAAGTEAARGPGAEMADRIAAAARRKVEAPR